MNDDLENLNEDSKKTEKNNLQSDFRSKNDNYETKEKIKDVLKKELIEQIKKGAEKQAQKLDKSEKLPERQKLNEPESKKAGISRLDSSFRSNLLSENQKSVNVNKEEQIRRIKNESKKDVQIRKVREKAQKEAQKETDEVLKHIENRKVRLLMKLAGDRVDGIAYAIAIKMNEVADKGGIYAVIIMGLSLATAISSDVLDYFMVAILIGIAGIITAVPIIIIFYVLWMINLFLSLTVALFWAVAIGGGHKKWFWRRMIIIIPVTIIEQVPAWNLLPLTSLMVLWNIYDYYKGKAKAKKEAGKFVADFNSTGKINKNVAEYI